MTTNEKFPVEIPACFIKDKAIDYDMELLAAMGASLPVGGFLVRPPSLGVFSLLELFESVFIAHPEECTVMELWRALYVNHHREECMEDVVAWAYPDKGKSFVLEDETTWLSFDWAVHEWGKKLELNERFDDLDTQFVKIYNWFNIAFEGFDMIPSSGSANNGEMWFGADSVGSLAHVVGCSLHDLLWELPMCYVGHRMAAVAKFNGNEHVKRKKDVADFKLKTEEARERVRKGELHPWQLQDPTNPAWPLTQKQIEFAPNLEDEWKKLVEEKTNG